MLHCQLWSQSRFWFMGRKRPLTRGRANGNYLGFLPQMEHIVGNAFPRDVSTKKTSLSSISLSATVRLAVFDFNFTWSEFTPYILTDTYIHSQLTVGIQTSENFWMHVVASSDCSNYFLILVYEAKLWLSISNLEEHDHFVVLRIW